MKSLLLAGLLVAACAGSPPPTPTPGEGETAPAEAAAPIAVAVEAPVADGGEAMDAAHDVDAADAGDAGSEAAPRVCSAAADYVPYVVDLGPAENSAKMGNYERSPSDEARPIRATLSALSAPKELDAFNFATYLPYYIAGAYQEAIATRPGLRGAVRLRLVLDATGKATQVKLEAPGFPKTFIDEVRDRASTTYVICPPLAEPATVSATIKLEPRTLRNPRKR